MDWTAPSARRELRQAIANLQVSPTEGSAQQRLEEPMDQSGSVVAASEADASEMLSEMKER